MEQNVDFLSFSASTEGLCEGMLTFSASHPGGQVVEGAHPRSYCPAIKGSIPGSGSELKVFGIV